MPSPIFLSQKSALPYFLTSPLPPLPSLLLPPSFPLIHSPPPLPHLPSLPSPSLQSPEDELLKEETAELAELFRLVDRDGGGTISMDEFLELLASLAVKPSSHEMTLLFNEIDLNQNHLIEMNEFMDFMQDPTIKQIPSHHISDAFKVFEGLATPARESRVSRADLIEGLSHYAPDEISMLRNERQSVGERGEEKQRALGNLLDAIPWDSDGYVDYMAFVRRNTHNTQMSSSRKDKVQT